MELEQRRDEEAIPRISDKIFLQSCIGPFVLYWCSFGAVGEIFLVKCTDFDAGKLLPLHRIGHSARNTCSVLRDLN